MIKILEPCPFCAGKAQLIDLMKLTGRIIFYVRCKKCSAVSGGSSKQYAAINKWNKRKLIEKDKDND